MLSVGVAAEKHKLEWAGMLAVAWEGSLRSWLCVSAFSLEGQRACASTASASTSQSLQLQAIEDVSRAR